MQIISDNLRMSSNGLCFQNNVFQLKREQKRPLWTCDAGRHLQECTRVRAGKCPGERFSSDLGRLARSAPKSAPGSEFFALLGLQNAKKALLEALLGALSARPPKSLKKHSLGYFPSLGPWALLARKRHIKFEHIRFFKKAVDRG